MKLEPNLRVARLAQIGNGELFLWPLQRGSCVGIKGFDPQQDNDPVVALLGPIFPYEIEQPCIDKEPQETVVTLGQEYILRLPSHANGWTSREPSSDILCVLVTEAGAFIRLGLTSSSLTEFRPAYFEVATGRLVGSNWNYHKPPGHHVFAIEWELTTHEADPQTIFKIP